MKKIILILIILFEVFSLYSQEETEEEIASIFESSTSEYTDEISKTANEFFGIDAGIKGQSGKWLSGRSSVLIEKGFPENTYEIDKISDSDLSTAWVEGAKGAGKEEYVTSTCFIDYSSNENTEKKVRVELRLNNGFCKSNQAFKKNNRVKELKIAIYEVPIAATQFFYCVDGTPVILHEGRVSLSDIMTEQVFSFDLVLKGKHEYILPLILARCTIKDVYKGTDYDDTCISELKISAKFIE
ncbi:MULTISPECIES: hypothetical protein [unclassified Treponema]|uniref:NADase-type glycan-binding domain-containing protein n=1 Tax=unclassified Treponema TaxID=2638727 RepID=UPI0020A382E1|nr:MULTISPECIES: hypothetical protein [unclassified Treponema]UTC68289.1 hypothetical protein E4O06_06570 [Treponema sp. OMZ 789]UTC71010.1 hypothetical protein E4O01_06715 [Treponema sp. OMZ 790]UTC73751.1 hypothetical protein E4O02_06910 [Treponema sp. OMZ 791]